MPSISRFGCVVDLGLLVEGVYYILTILSSLLRNGNSQLPFLRRSGAAVDLKVQAGSKKYQGLCYSIPQMLRGPALKYLEIGIMKVFGSPFASIKFFKQMIRVRLTKPWHVEWPKKLWTWSCRVDWSSDFVSLCRWSICRGFSFVVRWFFRSWNVSLFSSVCVFLVPWWIDLSLWIVKMWHLKELDLQNKVRIIS